MSELNEEILKLLDSGAKIERDKGVSKLEKCIADYNSNQKLFLINEVLKLIDRHNPWESIHGGLMSFLVLIPYLGPNQSHTEPIKNADNILQIIEQRSVELLEHTESRIRFSSGKVLGCLCAALGTEVYSRHRDTILNGVSSNLIRDSELDIGNNDKAGDQTSVHDDSTSKAKQIFHDTAGWKNLETWLNCLRAVMDGCGSSFSSNVDQELLSIVYNCLQHQNRFIRETAYFLFESIIDCKLSKFGQNDSLSENQEQEIAQQISNGLSDNWSQVRMAASVAARRFLQTTKSSSLKDTNFQILLPSICLNRYYIAEGVRIYNQKTWQDITGETGKELVEKYINHFIDFYISQSEAENHAVREAACSCIAELGMKINKECLKNHIPSLFSSLIICFKDQSWPVRDSACVACGNFVLSFPDESKQYISELYPLFYANLADSISSVRQGAAVALSNVVKAYGAASIEAVFLKLVEGFTGLKNQTPDSSTSVKADSQLSTYSVIKTARDNDIDAHSNQQMYSCGSLAPKMHRGAKSQDSSGTQFKTPTEPWQLTDGCFILLSQLSKLEFCHDKLLEILPEVDKTFINRQYSHHLNYFQTVCEQIPELAKGLGKKKFKSHLERFFCVIFYSVSCGNGLTEHAAKDCISNLSSFVGPNIFRGRVEIYNPNFLSMLL